MEGWHGHCGGRSNTRCLHDSLHQAEVDLLQWAQEVGPVGISDWSNKLGLNCHMFLDMDTEFFLFLFLTF